jgi:hypothetical protein
MPGPTPTIQISIPIPIPTGEQYANGTGVASGFTIHLKKVTKKPIVPGDKPLKGFSYIEFDVSVTNNTTNATFIPGMFYFQDSATGKLFMTADTFGYVSYNWIVSSFSQKHVTVSGKKPLMTTEIPAGQTVNNLYLIYQILPAEKGKLVWDNTSTLTPVVFGTIVAKNMQSDRAAQFIQLMMAGGELKLFELNAMNNESNRIEVFSIP